MRAALPTGRRRSGLTLTLETLRQGLRRGCHILHFSGHGGRATEGGYLLFEDEAGGRQRVDCHTLAHLLRGSQVRLAVLNACESALATDIDAFASVAAARKTERAAEVAAHGNVPLREQWSAVVSSIR